MKNMGDEYTVYLTSIGCMDIYPANTPCEFVNRLSTPIILSNDHEYEVGLVSIMYPIDYYAILSNDDEFRIFLHTRYHNNNDEEVIHEYTYKPNINVIAGDMQKLVTVLNDDITSELKIYFGDRIAKFVKRGRILKWDDTQKKIALQYVKGESFRKGEVKTIHMRFSGKAAHLLRFRIDTEYIIYGKDKANGSLSSTFPSENCGVDYIYIYSDIIHPSPFAGKLVNILDCFHIDNGRNKGMHNTLYKTINTKILDQISIIITDQNGRKISFSENSSITCVLHIRPR